MAELFRSQIRFYGKHGQYIEALSPGTEKAKDERLPLIERNKYLFKRVVDVYLIAPMVGYLYQRKSERDSGESNKNIMEGAISNEYNRLIFTYQMIMILDKEDEPDLDKRLSRAFRDLDKDNPEGLDLFNAYARGGIEVLYEKLIANAATPEDIAANLTDFIEDYSNKFLKAKKEITDEELLGITNYAYSHLE